MLSASKLDIVYIWDATNRLWALILSFIDGDSWGPLRILQVLGQQTRVWHGLHNPRVSDSPSPYLDAAAVTSSFQPQLLFAG